MTTYTKILFTLILAFSFIICADLALACTQDSECNMDGCELCTGGTCQVVCSDSEVCANGSCQNVGSEAAGGTGLSAVQSGLSKTATKTGLTTKADLPTMIGRIVNYLFSAIGIVFMTIVLVGGFLWMTAGGNEEKIGKAKGFIINGINGMIVIFLAYALVYTMLAALRAATTN